MPLTWTPPNAERPSIAVVLVPTREPLTRERYLGLLEVKFHKMIQAASETERQEYLSIPERWENLMLVGLNPMQAAETLVQDSEAVAAAVGADPALFPVPVKRMQEAPEDAEPMQMELGDLMSRLYPAIA